MKEGVSPVGAACEPIEKTVGKTVVKLEHGDLTALPVDAVVFYAKENLDLGSGYGTAIQTRGGAEIKKELDEIGSVELGGAVITTAGQLRARHIIHACGPKFQEPDLEKKLRECMMSSLKVANENGIKTIAYPPMGAGFYGIPLDLCARIMAESLRTSLGESSTSLEEVIICVVDYRDYAAFEKRLREI